MNIFTTIEVDPISPNSMTYPSDVLTIGFRGVVIPNYRAIVSTRSMGPVWCVYCFTTITTGLLISGTYRPTYVPQCIACSRREGIVTSDRTARTFAIVNGNFFTGTRIPHSWLATLEVAV